MTKFTQDSPLLEPLHLPCGAILPNRIAKAAMTERLAAKNKMANEKHVALYKHWSGSGSGLLISGNIMVDQRYKESAGNIVLEDEQGIHALKNLTAAGTLQGNHFWAQISHPGRQATLFSTFKPIAPSAVKLKKLMLFAKPRAMTKAQIEDVLNRYVRTAELCKMGGFTGVQIHAAHGYLLSQFLSPKTNRRIDQYGGSIENRAKLLFDIIKKIREVVGPEYPISVKLNSADFQRGGFEEEDAFFVIRRLGDLGIDLLEISGGTYENIVFLEKRYQRESTQKREAYFLDFANKVKEFSSIPLMVTGGFRSIDFCEHVLQNGELDVVGFARPYLLDKNFPSSLLDRSNPSIQDASFDFKIRKLADMAEAAYFDYQIHQLANNKELVPGYNPYLGVLRFTKNEMLKGWF
jgi:2,4-dienoyl-CoA reductase-like NADH-dependent reductase (Old Yellow Enzyme family)